MKLPFGGLWAEFKAFAFKGNMIELAVAVIIGGAFGKVVTSLVEDIIMPCVTIAVQTTKHAAVEGSEAVANTAKAAANTVGIKPASQPTTQAVTGTDADIAAAKAAADKAAADKATADAKAAEAKAAEDKAAADKAAAAAKPAPTEAVHIEWDIGPATTPIHLGRFIGNVFNFLLVAAAVFLMVVKLMGGVMKKMSKPDKPGEPTERECPECLSIIPFKAKRCSHCTSVIAPGAV